MPDYKLLSVSSDAKTMKGQQYDFLTGILYLQPASLSGKNLCPGSSPGCRVACLNLSGRSVAFPTIHKGRARKTELFLNQPQVFLNNLILDTIKLIKESKGKRFNGKSFRPNVRLNGTSDIDFSRLRMNRDVLFYPSGRVVGENLFQGLPKSTQKILKSSLKGKNLFEIFPDVQWMDYTKIPGRIIKNPYKNYHLTFSLSEKNEEVARLISNAGHNIAVVFNVDKNNPLPDTLWGREVIVGDAHDLRFLDKKGTIVGLRAKHRAKVDKTGFTKTNN